MNHLFLYRLREHLYFFHDTASPWIAPNYRQHSIFTVLRSRNTAWSHWCERKRPAIYNQLTDDDTVQCRDDPLIDPRTEGLVIQKRQPVALAKLFGCSNRCLTQDRRGRVCYISTQCSGRRECEHTCIYFIVCMQKTLLYCERKRMKYLFLNHVFVSAFACIFTPNIKYRHRFSIHLHDKNKLNEVFLCFK